MQPPKAAENVKPQQVTGSISNCRAVLTVHLDRGTTDSAALAVTI